MRTDIRESMFNKTSFFSSSMTPNTTIGKNNSRINYNPRERDISYDSFSKYRSEMNINDGDYNSNSSNLGGLITQSPKVNSRPITSSLNQTDGFNRITFK
jgi:hypothetical protein